MSSTNISDLSVLHIGSGRYNPHDQSHSTFAIWRELAKYFRRYTVVGRSNKESATLVEGNLTVHLLSGKMSRELGFLWLQKRAIPIATAVSADVVIAQSPVFGGLAGALIKRKHGSKLLIELHSDDYFADANICSKQWLLQKLTKYILREADTIRVLTGRMGDAFRERYGVDLSNRVVVLPPRVNLKTFQQKLDWGAGDSPLRAAVVGSVGPRKRQVQLLEVVLSSGINVEFWVVGVGPDLAACHEIVRKFGAEARVKFFGQVDHDELAKILRDVDALVMYSKNEGTPRAILEAMAVGLPIITTNVGYCSDIVSNGVEGFILGANPDAEIVSVLESLQKNRDLRKLIGQQARLRAVREFDADLLYARYRSIIEETSQRCR